MFLLFISFQASTSQNTELESNTAHPQEKPISATSLRLDLASQQGMWYENLLRGDCPASQTYFQQLRCPRPADLYVDPGLFRSCTFCNYLHRPQPIKIEPIFDNPIIVRRKRIANALGRLQQWSNQTRLASLVPVAQARRRIYLDMGARDYNSSMTYFRTRFPAADTFELKAWEIIPDFIQTFASHPEVELHQKAAWINNEPMKMANPGMAYMHEDASAPAEHTFEVASEDVSAYIKKEFVLDDFVIVKMDIEGAEFQVIPKMIADGSIHLIDEFLIECHYYAHNRIPSIKTVLWKDCLAMFNQLRIMGVYVHDWML